MNEVAATRCRRPRILPNHAFALLCEFRIKDRSPTITTDRMPCETSGQNPDASAHDLASAAGQTSPDGQAFGHMGASLAWRGRLGWRDEVVTALDQWIALEGGGGRAPQWRRVGAARSTAEPGIFVVDIRGSDLSADHLTELCLAGAAPDSVKAGFRAMDATVEGRLLRIRVAEFAAPPDPHVWILRHPPDFLLTALRDGIAGLPDGGLANLLARGEIGGTLSEAPAPPGLLPAQQLAYRACLGAGVWLVWGPPGTGKTRLLQAAIGDMITAGKRILLVSSTNIAVDNALKGVLAQQRHRPGEVVRVGPPQLREVAEDPDVCLPLMVRTRLAEVEERRRAVAEQLLEMRRDEDRLRHLDARLTGFDAAAYEKARIGCVRPASAPSPWRRLSPHAKGPRRTAHGLWRTRSGDAKPPSGRPSKRSPHDASGSGSRRNAGKWRRSRRPPHRPRPAPCSRSTTARGSKARSASCGALRGRSDGGIGAGWRSTSARSWARCPSEMSCAPTLRRPAVRRNASARTPKRRSRRSSPASRSGLTRSRAARTPRAGRPPSSAFCRRLKWRRWSASKAYGRPRRCLGPRKSWWPSASGTNGPLTMRRPKHCAGRRLGKPLAAPNWKNGTASCRRSTTGSPVTPRERSSKRRGWWPRRLPDSAPPRPSSRAPTTSC